MFCKQLANIFYQINILFNKTENKKVTEFQYVKHTSIALKFQRIWTPGALRNIAGELVAKTEHFCNSLLDAYGITGEWVWVCNQLCTVPTVLGVRGAINCLRDGWLECIRGKGAWLSTVLYVASKRGGGEGVTAASNGDGMQPTALGGGVGITRFLGSRWGGNHLLTRVRPWG